MKKILILLIILFSKPSIGYETYCDTLTANEKKRFDFCLAQDNISDDTSSGNYYRDALINGNKAYNNGNLERALFLWEVCANQYNPSKYQTTCRENISYVTSNTNTKKTDVKNEVIMNNNLELKADIILSGGVSINSP